MIKWLPKRSVGMPVKYTYFQIEKVKGQFQFVHLRYRLNPAFLLTENQLDMAEWIFQEIADQLDGVNNPDSPLVGAMENKLEQYVREEW